MNGIFKVNIKPLSINEAFKGRRYKTKKYNLYESELYYKLPILPLVKEKIKLSFVVGYSNPLSDIDNFLKPTIDVMQKKYNFDDKDIYQLHVKKTIVDKGNEFIKFKIEEIH